MTQPTELRVTGPLPPADPALIRLDAPDARALMTPHPVTVRQHQPLDEALDLMLAKDVSVVPVLDGHGRPVGVLSRSDIIQHSRFERYHRQAPRPDRPARDVGDPDKEAAVAQTLVLGVCDVMTPIVFSVTPETCAMTVIEEMVDRELKRLFVIDAQGELLGVISAMDVVRHLRSSAAAAANAAPAKS